MNKYLRIYCATDKEVFDVLESRKKQITIGSLLSLGRSRGIFYSPLATRDELIEYHSQLPHDHHSLEELLEHCGHSKRQEKITTKKITQQLKQENIIKAINKISENNTEDENYSYKVIDDTRIQVTIKYNDFNFGKTRLTQIQKEEAVITIILDPESTTIRLPANEKANGFYLTIKEQLESLLSTSFKPKEIELPENCSIENRTRFFITLISEMEGLSLTDVSNLRTSRTPPPELESNSEEDEDGQTSEELSEDDQEESTENRIAQYQMLSWVQNISLNGKNLQRSPEYRQLIEKGYFITSITWKSKRQDQESLLIECNAAFDNPEIGKGFKFSVKGCYRPNKTGYAKTIRPVDDAIKLEVMKAIENSAEKIAQKIADNISLGGEEHEKEQMD